MERDQSFAQRFQIDAGAFLWAGNTRSQGPQEVSVSGAGIHFLSIWIRESGQIIEVLQQGYLIGERVLRPAMVRVAA